MLVFYCKSLTLILFIQDYLKWLPMDKGSLNLERNPFADTDLKGYARTFEGIITNVCTGKLNWLSEMRTIFK